MHVDTMSFKCEKCDRGFLSEKTLENHIKRIHQGRQKIIQLIDPKVEEEEKKGNYGCYICRKKFRRRYLLRHIREIHKQPKKFPCDLCNEEFPTNGNLQRHIKGVHNQIKDSKCNQCDKSFYAKAESNFSFQKRSVLQK